jgi:hypothetical protein
MPRLDLDAPADSARALLQDLKTRGLLVARIGNRLLVYPNNCLTRFDLAQVALYHAEILKLAGDGSEYTFTPTGDVREWVGTLTPERRLVFCWAARLRVRSDKVDLVEAQRRTAAAFQQLWNLLDQHNPILR